MTEVMEEAMTRKGPISRDDLDKIDAASRRVLQRTGLRVTGIDDDCRRALKSAGATFDDMEQRLFLEPGLLDDLLISAPSRFTLCSRNGANDVQLGSGRVHFANGGRVIRILDLATGGYRQTMLRDIAHTAMLVEQLENLSFYIIACQACDLPSDDNYHLNDFYQAMAHTSKHVMGGCGTRRDVERVYHLAGIIAGGERELRERPCISIITNPMSPLTVSGETLSIVKFCAEKQLPLTCAPAPNAGSTAPGTLAGTLVQMHAEALAGVAIAQAFSPGAKCLYGAVPTTMDLRMMNFSIGSVESALLNSAAVQMAKLYDLPIYGTGGGTEAKRPNIQAGAEKSFSNILVAQAGADCIHLAAGMLDSANSISYEQYLIDDEIIGMVLRMLKGISVNADTMGEAVIDKVGPGGHYVTEDHTVEHMFEEFFYPNLADRSLFDVWERNDRPDMLSNARKQVRHILADKTEGVLEPQLIVRLKKTFSGLIA